jgi:hypothetical protein
LPIYLVDLGDRWGYGLATVSAFIGSDGSARLNAGVTVDLQELLNTGCVNLASEDSSLIPLTLDFHHHTIFSQSGRAFRGHLDMEGTVLLAL